MSGADWGAVLMGQVTDPLRIGLLVFLVLTMLRTEANTGRWVPLALGVAFVAVLLPMTTGAGTAPLAVAVVVGLAVNAVVVALVLAVVEAFRRRR